jgi:hypothetical protein
MTGRAALPAMKKATRVAALVSWTATRYARIGTRNYQCAEGRLQTVYPIFLLRNHYAAPKKQPK